jgi:hypothetical protein
MDIEPANRERVPVLYIGWSGDAADALVRHGSDTTFVVAAADAGAAGAHPGVGRVVVVPDPERVDDVVAGLLRASIDVRGFTRVCTEHEQAMVQTAVIAEAYGRPGLAVRTAVAVRDKFVQKRLVREAGIPVARCRTVDGVEELGEHPPPFVVKPLDGAGTRLTYAVPDVASLARAARDITASGETGPWLVEEFMSGSELHVDGVVRDGTVTFFAVSRYLQNIISIQHGAGMGSVVVDPDRHPDLYERAHRLASASLEALGHVDGVFHLEAFEDGDTLAFSECAGRIAGGLLWETIIIKFGVDLYDEWARTVLGRPCGIAVDRRTDHLSYGWVHLKAPAGRVRSIPSPEELRARPGVVQAQVSFRPGDTIPDLSLASHLRAARVLMTGETEDSVADKLRSFSRWFRDQVSVAA